MEHITTRMFRDLKQLEDGIQAIPPPKASWSEFGELKQERGHDPPSQETLDDMQLSLREFLQKAKETETFVDLNQKPTKDHHTLIHLCHKMIKNQGGEIPKTVFMGGNSLKTYLAFFRRPLVTQDFLRLWSIGLEGNEEIIKDEQ